MTTVVNDLSALSGNLGGNVASVLDGLQLVVPTPDDERQCVKSFQLLIGTVLIWPARRHCGWSRKEEWAVPVRRLGPLIDGDILGRYDDFV